MTQDPHPSPQPPARAAGWLDRLAPVFEYVTSHYGAILLGAVLLLAYVLTRAVDLFAHDSLRFALLLQRYPVVLVAVLAAWLLARRIQNRNLLFSLLAVGILIFLLVLIGYR